MQDTSIKSQNNKNDVANTFYKNCNNESYKIKSKLFFLTTLIVVWSLVTFLFWVMFFSARSVDNDNVFAIRGSGCFFDILFDLGYDESALTGLDTFLSRDSSKLSVTGSYKDGHTALTETLESNSSLQNGATLSKFTGKLGDDGTYSGDYTFSNATLVMNEQLWSLDGWASSIEPNIVLTSLDLTPLSNYLSSLEMDKAFIGFEICFPTDGNVAISGNVVTSGDNYLTGIVFQGGDFNDIGYGCILKAVWGTRTYTYNITCNNTGTGGTTTTTVTSASTTTITAGTKTGYDFSGWMGDLTNSNATLTIDGSTLSGNITLTANWKAQVYTITYNYTGDLANADKLTTDWGGKTAPTTHTYDSATSLVLPSRTGYKFEGWYTSSVCTGTALSSLSATGYTANIALYGKWTKKQSVITINIVVTGASSSYGNEIILYLIIGGKVQSQIVASNGKKIVLTQSVGENYAILVSKPYMWTLTVSGDCTQDTANKNKITYTITKDNKSITLTFSGGASSSMICV